MRILIALFIVLAIISGLIWYFATDLAVLAQTFWGLSEETRNKISFLLDTVGKVGGLFIATVLGVWKLLKGGKQTGITPQTPAKVSLIADNELEQHYYANLAEHCQRYDLGNFRESRSISEQALQVKLADVYVDLMAHEIKAAEAQDGEGHMGRPESKLLLDILADTSLNRLVVRGDVGSGKSSFINYLCYSIIASGQGHDVSQVVPGHWLRRPVVRLLLREIGGKICPASDLEAQLFEFIRQRMHAHISNRCKVDEDVFGQMWAWFRAAFEKNGVLILDGLDEVSGSHEKAEELTRRQILLTAVQRFASNGQHKGMAIIVTSRNHAYGGDDALSGFRLFQLDPLNISGRVDVFIKHWYQQVAQTQEEKQANQADALSLLNNIAKRDSLQALTATPLLLTLILVLDKAKVGLPESRAELYQSAASLLLDRWNKQLLQYAESLSDEEQQALDVLKLDANILLAAMKTLAYQTYQEAEGHGKANDETIVFTVDKVEKALKEQLQQHTGLGFAHQDSCKYFLRFRSQLLVAVGEGISFVHKSFHEYLVAAHVMGFDMSRDMELWKMAASADKRDWWQEVFLFALNIGKAEYVMKLMKEQVLSRQVASMKGDELENHLGSLSLFSHAALENNLERVVSRSDGRNPYLGSAYHDLQEHIKLLWEDKRLEIPQRAQLGRIWGRCGDVREGLTFQRRGYVIRYHSTATRSFPLPGFDWQKIKEGEFMMGTVGDEGYGAEKPAHPIRFDKPFYMVRAAVTNAQYQVFMDAGGYEDDSIWEALPAPARAWRRGEFPGLELVESIPEEYRENYRQALLSDRSRHQPRFWQDNRWNIANHPVVGVSWFEALAYCEWLNRNQSLVLPDELLGSGLTIRLPTEDEWEYAARGVDALRYACGEAVSSQLANYEETQLKRTTAAGVFAPGVAFGLHDMTGNVWDWTSSRWGKDFGRCAFGYENYIEQRKDQNRLDDLEYRIIRGGSWYDASDYVRCAIRNGYHPYGRNDDLGFRLVLGL